MILEVELARCDDLLILLGGGFPVVVDGLNVVSLDISGADGAATHPWETVRVAMAIVIVTIGVTVVVVAIAGVTVVVVVNAVEVSTVVAGAEEGSKTRVVIIVAVLLMRAGSLSEEAVLRALAASVSLGTAVVYLGMGIDLQIRRYVGVGIAGLILAAIILSQSATFSEAWLLVGVGWMAILTVSGLWAFRQSVLTLAESPSD